MKKAPNDHFEERLKLNGVTGYIREHRFFPSRRWRFDFSFPEKKIAIEIDGENHHNHAQAIKDAEKRVMAAKLGWNVIVLSSRQTAETERDLLELIKGEIQ